jgi:hypothetical protein
MKKLIEQFKQNHPEIKLDYISNSGDLYFTDSNQPFDITEFIKGSNTRICLEKLLSELKEKNFIS